MKYAYHTSVVGILFLLFASSPSFTAQSIAAPEPEKAPVVQWSVSFERSTLRENDRLPIRVLIANPSDKPLSNVTLSWNNLPGTITLYPVSCDQAPAASPQDKKPDGITIGALPAQSDPNSVHPVDLCLTSTSVNNGDYNLLFVLRYDWPAKQGTAHAVLTAEKSIKSAFLGTDSLAGVPLALAGFIVPGLLFWLALDWWKTPWRIQGPTLGDKTVYSILVSLLLITLVSWSPQLKEDFDITQGLSLKKLEYLAALGAAAGMVVGFFDRWLRNRRTRGTLQQNDDDLTLFTKLLRLNVARNEPKTLVTLTNGQVYQGSVGGQGATQTFLVGWYRVQPNPDHANQTSQIRDALKDNEMVFAAKLMRDFSFPLDVHDYIYQQGAKGQFGVTKAMRMVWANTEVQGKPAVEVDSGTKPLTME